MGTEGKKEMDKKGATSGNEGYVGRPGGREEKGADDGDWLLRGIPSTSCHGRLH